MPSFLQLAVRLYKRTSKSFKSPYVVSVRVGCEVLEGIMSVHQGPSGLVGLSTSEGPETCTKVKNEFDKIELNEQIEAKVKVVF